MNAENDQLNQSGLPELSAARGSATCCICKWTNVSLLNLGEHGSPRWTCHGCCKRMLAALERILWYPVHSEPVGVAMAMQDIAHDTLSPNVRLNDGDNLNQTTRP